MKTLVLCIALTLPVVSTWCQSRPYNLVPDPGFEVFREVPIDWFYTGTDFSNAMQYWDSPTGASPDVYGPRIAVPHNWRDKGFGNAYPLKGQSMAGLTLYGCQKGKPHCREYVQTQLIEPLVPDQRYEVIFWVSHLPNSLQINQIGCAFSIQHQASELDEVLALAPEVFSQRILYAPANQWLQVRQEFTARTPAEYMIIGNFSTDASTEVARKCAGKCLPFAYYYIDEVSVRKLPPILPVPEAQYTDFSRLQLRTGDTVLLKYVYFDLGQAEFVTRSFREVHELLGLLLDHPEMIIELHGHTDNLGSHAFNDILSVRRAQTVVEYLIKFGIDPSRLSVKGFGSRRPVADNDTDEGRSRNRRVEFHIVQKK